MSDLTPELLLYAYRSGVFPMAESQDDPEVFWVDPKRRGILPLDQFHISRSLARTLRQERFQITLNAAFEHVLAGCADRDETWINPDIFTAYMDLHASGHAHSLEVWDGDTLAGGVYGVAIGGAFFGESMFSRRKDASKVALAWLVNHLHECGFALFDTQFITPHLSSLGAIEIPRGRYRRMLEMALDRRASIAAQPLPISGQDVVQRNGQTS